MRVLKSHENLLEFSRNFIFTSKPYFVDQQWQIQRLPVRGLLITRGVEIND